MLNRNGSVTLSLTTVSSTEANISREGSKIRWPPVRIVLMIIIRHFKIEYLIPPNSSAMAKRTSSSSFLIKPTFMSAV